MTKQAGKAHITAEEKLKALHHLQKLHSNIDEIRILRGELPIEVRDLEDEMEGLERRLDNVNNDINSLQTGISNNNTAAEHAKALIERYEKQRMNVKNNREYDALSKEIEMQELEIELLNKRNRDAEKNIGEKNSYLEESRKVLESRQKDLAHKRKELEDITAQTEKQEKELMVEVEKAQKDIESRLLVAYNRIRKTYRNGLAVVLVERDSCGGCFGKIPPQRQLEIRQHQKIILCEHCGRILVDPTIDEVATQTP